MMKVYSLTTTANYPAGSSSFFSLTWTAYGQPYLRYASFLTSQSWQFQRAHASFLYTWFSALLLIEFSQSSWPEYHGPR